MTPKVNFLYQFDKGFFGKTLLTACNSGSVKGAVSTKAEFDSVSDFMKYFEGKIRKCVLERTPEVDNFKPSEDISDVFPGIIP